MKTRAGGVPSLAPGAARSFRPVVIAPVTTEATGAIVAPEARAKTSVARSPAEVAPTSASALLVRSEARRRGASVGALGNPRRPNTVIAAGASRVTGRAQDAEPGGHGANGS